MSGPDADLFEISDDGVLTFEDPPDFEDAKDGDEDPDSSGDQGAGDNVYMVTVEALGGSLDVAVTVTNVNEPGMVTFTQLQAQATRDLTAEYDDDDNAKDPTWQWSRGPSATGPWTEIDGATSADRQPTDDDVGNWLLATVSYTDTFGAQTAMGAIGPVVDETLANAAPSFAGLDDDDDAAGVQIELEFNENADGDIGDPLVAKDPDGDPRLYTITGGLDADCFGIAKTTGQLSLAGERDFETPTAACKTGGDARTADADPDDDRTVDGTNDYVVVITATDPSGATGSATVTVSIQDVNEAAEFATAAKADANITLYIDENEVVGTLGGGADLALRQNEVDADETADTGDSNTAVADYAATDEDAGDADTSITYKVEGPDAKHFTIGGATGAEDALGIASGADLLGTDGADFEDKNSYSIIIVAESGGSETPVADTATDRTVEDVDRTRYATLAVTIKVVDQEDDGEVKISVQEPQEGKSLHATLTDEDGGVTGVSWQWQRIAALMADGDDEGTDPDPVKTCADVDDTLTDVAWADITDATSPIYTPDSYTFDHDGDGDEATDVSPEVGYCLRATATYTDNIANPDDDDTTADVDESKDTAMESPTRAVQRDDPANTAPEFDDDQDPNTPGDQPVAERSVMENTEGKVGEPVVADDSDLLVYSVDDTDNFKVDNMGQISTAVELDYEALPDDAKYYMVTLTATDPSGASDTIMVKIAVTDEDDDAVITGMMTVSYDENDDAPVATFVATDEDADAGDPEWKLSGPDADLFEISDDGVLTFEDPPDFETAKDGDEDEDTSGDQGAGDNVYMVTVEALGGDLDVAVTVINLNEPGTVTFTQLQAQATRDLVAEYEDDDNAKDPTWQWSRGPSATGPWTEITGATSADRPPGDDDIGGWLLATVSYTDSFGAQTAMAAIGPVVDEALANAAPSFAGLDDDEDAAGVQIELEFNENADGNIGDPLLATDADGDPRLYTITGGLDADCFGIGETSGQLSLSGERDFENVAAACKTGGDPRTAAGSDDRDADGTNDYVVEITATDPTGATGSATVTVSIQNVNEAAEFATAAKADANVTLYIDENETTAGTAPELLALRQNEVDQAELATPGTNTPVVAYTAADEDDDATLDADANITYKVEGPDAKHFTIGETDGVLAFMAGDDLLGADGADFEDKDSYSITVVAESGGFEDDSDGDPDRTVGDVDRTRYATLAVTIKVVDQEDDGEVKISVQEPQEGKSVLATLSDEDGGVTGVSWQWARIAALAADDTNVPADADSDPDPVKACADVLVVPGTAGREWADITDANSPLYTPASYTYDHDGDDATAEVGYCLRATATYTDNIANPADDASTTDVDESKDTAMESPTRAVQMDDPANTAPEFNDDQDPNTPGDQPVAERSVMENTEGKVGEPVVAADDDLLVYSVDDTDNFKVDNMGQISTAVELDYEALPDDAKYYMVTLTATDPSGASDTIMVKITVIDEDDDAVITLGPAVNTPPAFDEGTGEGLMVYENMPAGTSVGTVTATDEDANDTIEYTLGGASADYFAINGATGEITTSMELDYEMMASHLVTVSASDGTDIETMSVTIAVMNMYPGCTVEGNIGLSNDCEVLLDAKDTLEGTGTSLTWSEDTSIVHWLYVVVSGDPMRVTQLRLTRKGLEGEIPASLAKLSELTELNLNENSLHGTVPGALGDLKKLSILRVQRNELTGIDDGLGGATSLTRLFAQNNHLTGEIPSDLGMLSNLEWLRLDSPAGDGSGLTGSIPVELGNLSSLTNLYLHGNMVTGSIPSELGNLSSLTHITLQQNDLSGPIPDLSGLTNLVWLGLYGNGLTGGIPSSLGALVNLERLYLHGNSLTGEVPGSIGNLTALTNLWLKDNSLSGDLPDTLDNLVNLERVRISGNSFTGCVPAALANAASTDVDAADACASGDGS